MQASFNKLNEQLRDLRREGIYLPPPQSRPAPFAQPAPAPPAPTPVGSTTAMHQPPPPETTPFGSLSAPLPEFIHGKTEVEPWIDLVDTTMTLANVRTLARVTAATRALHEVARRAMYSAKKQAQGPFEWPEFCTVLKEVFMVKKSDLELRGRLESIKCCDRSVQDYAVEFEAAAHMLQKPLSDEEMMHTFMKGLPVKLQQAHVIGGMTNWTTYKEMKEQVINTDNIICTYMYGPEKPSQQPRVEGSGGHGNRSQNAKGGSGLRPLGPSTATTTPTAFTAALTAATATTAITAATAATAAPVCCATMASLQVLAFDHEGRPVQFDTWLDDLQLYLLSDSKDSVSLFDPVSGAATAPPTTANSATHSQRLTRDAAARLAIRNHLPLAECAHFGQHSTAQALYDALVARYSSPATAALGRPQLHYLFPELSAFATVDDMVSYLRTSNAHYRATVPAEFLDRNQPPMFITLYFIVTRLRDSLRSVRDHFLSLDPTSLTVELLEEDLLAIEASAVAVGAAPGTPRPAFFEGCSRSPIAPSYASAAAADVSVAEDGGAASASAKRHSNKGKGGRGGGGGCCGGEGGRGGGGGGSSGGGRGIGGGEDGGTGGGNGGSGGGGGGSGGSGRSGGGGIGGGRTGPWRGRPGDLLRSGVAIFDLDYDAILSAMYALSASAEGDCYRCVPRGPGIADAALGASEFGTLLGTAPAEALHTFALDSGASCCFFCDSTTLTPLLALVPVRLADSSGGPVMARSSTVLPCPVVPSGSLSERHLATFTRWPGSILYTLAIEPPQVAPSAQVSALGQVAASCSCRLLSHQTLLWHHCQGHPSLPHLHGMHSRLLVFGLPRSLPPLPPSPAPPCLPCVEGQQRSAPHSSSFPPTSAPLQTLHMDVWGPARVSGQGRERYFLLVIDDLTRYTTVFPLRSKGEVSDVLIAWIRTICVQLRERFGQDLPLLRLHSNRGGEFSSDLLRDFFRGEGILQSFMLPDSPQQNGIAERRIGLVMEVARTTKIHVAAPYFLWLFAVRYAAHQLNLWPPFVRDTSADKLSARAIPCVFLGFVPDAPGWQFYHPTSRRVLPSQDITFDESVPFYRLFPYRSAPPPPPPLFLAPGTPPGAECGGAEPRGEEPRGAEPAGVEPGGAEPEGVEPRSAESEGAESGGATLSGGPAATGAGGAGDAGSGGVGSTAGAGGLGGTAAAGPGGARTTGISAGGAGAAGAGAVDPGARGAGGTVRPRPYFVSLLQQVLSVSSSTSLTPPLPCPPHDQTQPPLLSASPLPAPSPYTEQSGGIIERREPASRPLLPVRTARRVPHSRRPPVPGTHAMALRPSSVPLRVLLTAPPESSLPAVPDPESDRARATSPTVSRLLATAVTDPSFESVAASTLVAKLVDFAAACRLDYATALVAESESASPPSVGDPDAPDIPTPRSYAEAIEGPYSSQWHAAMDAKMLSWKSTSTYVDKVPAPGANIVDGIWIFRVQWPPGSPHALMARYVATGFSQRQGREYELHSLDFSTDFLQGSLHEEIWLRRPPGFIGSFPASTQWSLRRPVYGLRQAPREWHDTLRTTLAALGFSPSIADPSLFLRTDTSLPPFYVLVYVHDLVFATAVTESLTLVKSELQKRHTCTDVGELRSYLGLHITRDKARRTITLTRSHLVHQVLQRFGFQFSSPMPTPLSASHSLRAPPLDESVEPIGPYPELVGCLMYLMTCTRPDLVYPLSLLARYVAPGRHRKVHWNAAKRVLRYLCSTSGMGLVLGGRGPVVLTGHADASWAEIYAGAMAAQELRWLTYLLTDLGEQPRLPPVLYVDNKAMIALCQEHRLEHRTKHIALS
ncbi:unnamed protein product [Closterium sp. NIES-54]